MLIEYTRCLYATLGLPLPPVRDRYHSLDALSRTDGGHRDAQAALRLHLASRDRDGEAGSRCVLMRYHLYLCCHTHPVTTVLVEERTGLPVRCEYITLTRLWDGAFAKPVGGACVYLMDDEITLCRCHRRGTHEEEVTE